jgi:uracil-DNA glycosylase
MFETDLPTAIAACRLCADRFAATATGHAPNPVVWFRPGARILIASQAPGLRVHRANTPFRDPSGVRLRAWLGLDEAVFYDRTRIAILPSAFCFPGYDAAGSDLPPPPVCWHTWHARALAHIGPVPLRVIVGGHAHRRHLGARTGVTDTVRNWRAYAPDTFVLPHPSWRNNAWLARNPWVEADLLPALRRRVAEVLDGAQG